MTNGQRTVTTLLAVIAVLLGANLIVRGPSHAAAQEPELRVEGDRRMPRVIQIEPVGTLIYRLWSDGVIERAVRNIPAPCSVELSCGWTVVADDSPPQPFARIVQIGHAGGGSDILYRLRSNGVLEWTRTTTASCDPPWCDWQVVPEVP